MIAIEAPPSSAGNASLRTSGPRWFSKARASERKTRSATSASVELASTNTARSAVPDACGCGFSLLRAGRRFAVLNGPGLRGGPGFGLDRGTRLRRLRLLGLLFGAEGAGRRELA